MKYGRPGQSADTVIDDATVALFRDHQCGRLIREARVWLGEAHKASCQRRQNLSVKS